MARILIIEDNPANLKLMAYLLTAFGHEPLEAADGETGLERVRENPDLILCDVQLPGISGEEVARYLRSHPEHYTIPLVAVTAFAMVGDRERIMSAGFDGYLSKPLDPESFREQIDSFLRITPAARIPVPEAAAPEQAPAAASGPVTGEKTILVVGNLPVHLELARSILEPFGYRVVGAGGVEEGLAKAREHHCDLIVSDICMPEGSGFELLAALKAAPDHRHIPVVLITSTQVTEAARAQALLMGAARFLVRPIEPEAFLSEITACLK